MLDLDMEFKQGILFVRLKGILNGDNCTTLDEQLTSLIKDNGIKYVLINLNKLRYIDKYGINVLLKNYIYISSNNGKFIIVGINKLFDYNVNIIDNLYQVEDEITAFKLVNI